MYLIAGLGNPGAHYLWTRHNVGFMLADRLVAHRGGRFKARASALVSKVSHRHTETLVAKPLTYMNRSGRAVARLLDLYQIEPHRLVVAYDDVALPFGRIRLRSKGSAGGHNGMRSIIDTLGSQEFIRIRIGIDRERRHSDLSDFVLSDFDKKEMEELTSILDRAIDAIDTLVEHGIEHAMSLFNSK